MHKLYCILFVLLLGRPVLNAQELNVHVLVSAQQLGTQVESSLVNNLQQQITDFLNNRKWTNDQFLPEEKINCNISIALTSMPSQDVYQARLIVQAARPVYNSVYQSVLVNYQDQQFTFKFRPFQKLDFNPSRVAGNDPLEANLTAVLAYYANIILGLNYDSFKQEAGAPYFKAANNIVLSAPQSGNIKGWQAFDGQRNRYWLAHNLTDAKLNDIHHIFYTYFRQGLDSLYEQPGNARENILKSLTALQKLNKENPNTMIEQFFVENRSMEFIGLFKEAIPAIKAEALQALILLNPNSANDYNTALK